MTTRTAAILATLLAMASPAADARDKLRIATEGGFAPWNATSPTGNLVGFEIDLARELCRRMEADCTIVAQDWDGILPGLQQGRYDAVLAAVTVTPERARIVDFSIAYAADPATFAVDAASPLARAFPAVDRLDLAADPAVVQPVLSDLATALAGQTVGVQTATVHARMLERLLPGVTVRTYDKLDHAALDLAAGRIGAVLTARTTVTALSTDRGRVVPVGPLVVHGPLALGAAVAVRKGDAQLRARLDRAIEQAAAAGTTAQLSKAWFGFDVSLRPSAGAGE